MSTTCQIFPILYNSPTGALTQKIAPIFGGSWLPWRLICGSLDPRESKPNKASRSVKHLIAGLTNVTNTHTQTQRQTTERATYVVIGHIYAMQAMCLKKKSYTSEFANDAAHRWVTLSTRDPDRTVSVVSAAALCENKTSFIQPEIHDISQHQDQITATANIYRKFGEVCGFRNIPAPTYMLTVIYDDSCAHQNTSQPLEGVGRVK